MYLSQLENQPITSELADKIVYEVKVQKILLSGGVKRVHTEIDLMIHYIKKGIMEDLEI